MSSCSSPIRGDVLTLGWTLAWAELGWLIYKTVLGLQVIADGDHEHRHHVKWMDRVLSLCRTGPNSLGHAVPAQRGRR